jgi:hypothetical protein
MCSVVAGRPAFLDFEGRQDLGDGWAATLMGRRGWTDFAGGKFQTGAYSFDLSKYGLFGSRDRLGFRIAQPLRVENGGISMMLPTGYDYATETETRSLERLSFTPSGREVDAEVSYATALGRGWLGANLYARRQPGHIASADPDRERQSATGLDLIRLTTPAKARDQHADLCSVLHILISGTGRPGRVLRSRSRSACRLTRRR